MDNACKSGIRQVNILIIFEPKEAHNFDRAAEHSGARDFTKILLWE